MEKDKVIYIFLGPKGSGKSFLGTLMDKHFGIRFVRVEDWAKQVKGERSVDNESYLREVFAHIEKGIRKELTYADKIVFESTGLTSHFDHMLANLQRGFTVILIGVQADAALCLKRVKERDTSIHINVSDEQVNHINNLVAQKSFELPFVIQNENRNVDSLLQELRDILR